MNAIIDADAAKLAGLQIDLLQKVRQGHVTLDHLEWFCGLNACDRNHLIVHWKELLCEKPSTKPVSSTEPTEKFALLVDLGIITVPDDYDHATCLAKFHAKHQGGKNKSFYYYNDNITDKNFPNPTRILKPGDKLRVRAFKQIVGGSTTSEERLAFLATQKAIYTGAQGASLVFEQKRDQLPKGKWYASFDEKEALWSDAGGGHGVPCVDRHSDGGFWFNLGRFESDWDDDHCLLCFCDLEPSGA